MFAIGSALGPAPYPEIVSYFQSVVGREARTQFLTTTGKLPNKVVACIGGGSNAIGIFSGFLGDEGVEKIGVEPAGEGLDTAKHAATMSLGVKGEIHGFKCYVLLDEQGEPAPVHSIASGLDYPGVGPQHSHLRDSNLATYESATDSECLEAFMALSRLEGIIPALETAHAIAYAMKTAKNMSADETILVNLSGRGDKDIDFILDKVQL
jgi:tryptophan synthase beta chain